MPRTKEDEYTRAIKAADRRFDRSMATLRKYFDRRRYAIENRRRHDYAVAQSLIVGKAG